MSYKLYKCPSWIVAEAQPFRWGFAAFFDRHEFLSRSLFACIAVLTFDSYYICTRRVVAHYCSVGTSHLQLEACAPCAAGLPKHLHHWLSSASSKHSIRAASYYQLASLIYPKLSGLSQGGDLGCRELAKGTWLYFLLFTPPLHFLWQMLIVKEIQSHFQHTSGAKSSIWLH